MGARERSPRELPNGDHEIEACARTKRLYPWATLLAVAIGACAPVAVFVEPDRVEPEGEARDPDETQTARPPASPDAGDEPPEETALPPRERLTGKGVLGPGHLAAAEPEAAPEPTAAPEPEGVPEPTDVPAPTPVPESVTREPVTGATQPPGKRPAASSEILPVDEAEYRIGAGDVLEILVWKNEQLSRTIPVTPRGTISLPLLGEVEAAGRTPAGLREDIAGRLSGFIQDPEVSVLVVEVRSFNVSVIGEVRQAGRYELRSVTTVLEALALAGGPTEFASRGGIAVLRHERGETRRIPFDYSRAISGDAAANFPLRPGDIVVVP